jgi:Na+/melibiose symporter-like transporter
MQQAPNSTDPGIGRAVEAPPEETLSTSPEWRRRRVGVQVVGIVAAVVLVVALLLWFFVSVPYINRTQTDEHGTVSVFLWVAAIGATVIGIASLLWCYARYATAEREFQERLDRERTERLRAARDEAVPAAEAKLTRLVDANRALLDEYQKPVRAQARTSYTFAQIAIFVGLVVLVAGVLITRAGMTPGALNAGA